MKASMEKLFKFRGLDGVDYSLTMKEKIFCEMYLDNKGNGTEAAYMVYKPMNKNIAAVMARKILKKGHIMSYITMKLDEYGFNDDNVDKQHLFLINQFGDLNAKSKGIDMFRKMKGQYAPEQIKYTLDDDSLEARLAEIRARKRTLGSGGAGDSITTEAEQEE